MDRVPFAVVGGCGSSGTTLLTYLLSRHPAIGSGPELNCFNRADIFDFDLFHADAEAILHRRRRIKGYWCTHSFLHKLRHCEIDDRKVMGWIRASNSTAEFIGHVVAHMQALNGKPVFVEKTPSNVYAFARFVNVFPHVPLIHVIRDGRDVVASLLKRGFSLFGAGSRWLYDVSAGLCARGAPSYMEVRYEDLVRDPRTQLARIFERLGVDAGVDVLGGDGAASPGERAEYWLPRTAWKTWQNLPSETISTSSVGQYRDCLSSSDLSTLARIALTTRAQQTLGVARINIGELLVRLGYDDSRPPDTEMSASFVRQLKEKWVELQDYKRRLRSGFRDFRPGYWDFPPRCTRIESRPGR